MPEPLRHSEPQPVAPANPPSLWRELADGSAGPIVRAAVSFALAPLLAGAAFLGSFAVAGVVPQWAHHWSGRFRPADELVGGLLLLAGVAYLACLVWIWTRSRVRWHAFLKAGLLTALVTFVTVVLAVFIAETGMLRASEEVLNSGVVCVGGAIVILIWVQAARHHRRRKPLHDAVDGALDLHCPNCGYRMVGLRESRCPECGTAYTLDELLARQEFLTGRRPTSVAGDGNGARVA